MRIAILFFLSAISLSANAGNTADLLTELTEMADKDKGAKICPEVGPNASKCKSSAESEYAAKCQRAKELAGGIDASADELADLVVKDIGPNSDICKSQLEQAAEVNKSVATVCEKCWKAIEAMCTDKACSPIDTTCQNELQAIKEKTKPLTKDPIYPYKQGEENAIAAVGKCTATRDASQGGAAADNNDEGGTDPASQAGQPPTQPPSSTPTDSGTQQPQAQNGGGAGGMEGLAEMMKPKEEEAKEEEEEEETDDEPVVVDCATDEKAYLYKACASKVLSRCTAEPTLSMCASFNARYCAAPDGVAADAGSNNPNSTKGAGYGGDYCKAKAMGEFCSVPSHNGICPSCTGAGMNTSPDQAHNVSFACDGRDGTGADPYYSSAGYQSHVAAAGGGSSGGGVSAGDGTTPVVQSVGGETALEDTSREGSGLGVDSAGGYSSPGGSGIYGEEPGTRSKMKKAGKRTVASAASVSPSGLSRRVTDVGSNQFGNVFSIGSEVIRIRCLQGKHLHCAPAGK